MQAQSKIEAADSIYSFPATPLRPPRSSGGRRPLEAAGRTLLVSSGGGSSAPARPVSAGIDDQEDDWRLMRASIKSRGRLADPPEAKPEPSSVVSGARHSSSAASGAAALGKEREREAQARGEAQASKPSSEEMSLAIEVRESAYFERAKVHAKAHASAYYEDLIQFFEMHKLSGAYALAFAANGVEDLAQLLLMESESLDKVIANCDLDAMDEILIRNALRESRGE
mmetsp:Transcript_59681/g.131033  ORF Transcript_59681/g.131033 Transcript_59681/m.131033 type:complete len:227 (-) Transcript_59681:38-718(-)